MTTVALGSWPGGFAWAFSRDFRLAWRNPGETVLVIAFFVLVASLFPLGVGPDMRLLERIGPGGIWVCALPPAPHLWLLAGGLIVAARGLPAAVCLAIRIALD